MTQQKDLNSIKKYLQTKGVIYTPKRELILKKLIEKKHLQNVDLFWIELKQTQKISRATIYTTLNILCEIGIADKYYDKKSNSASYRYLF